jgi:hypothetical protein
MSGLFQRIAHRPDSSPDEAAVDEATVDEAAANQAAANETATAGRTTADVPPTEDAPTQTLPAAAPPPAAAPAVQPASSETTQVAEPTATGQPARRPGFRERGRMRRRLRYLRRLRELQVRDLGGLVFDLRRFERKRDDLLAQKIDRIRACDDELRALERALDERRDVRDVREPGIGGTCPRCFALHSSRDRFCASCGVALGGAVQGPAQVAMVAPPPAPPAQTPPPPPPVVGPEDAPQ